MIIRQGTNSAKCFVMAGFDVLHFRGLAPNYRQDSIRSGYVSDHESRSGYEHRGEEASFIKYYIIL